MIDLNILSANRVAIANRLQQKAESIKQLPFNEINIEIDFTSLPTFNSEKSYSEKLKIIHPDIMNEYRGGVYVFHLPDTSKDQIIAAIKTCRTKGRNTPSLKGIDKRNPSVLYVGSVKSHFYSRFIQHLGYGSSQTQALHLIHWAAPLFPKIKMTYLPIDFSDLFLHRLIEAAMCNTVTPMIGRMEKD